MFLSFAERRKREMLTEDGSRKVSYSCPTFPSLVPYLPADRPHFFPGKMGPKLGLRLIRGYKRFDTSLICTRTHGSTVNWRFNVRFKLFLTYNTYNYPVLDLNNFFFPMKTIESLGCSQYAGAAYLRVNMVSFCLEILCRRNCISSNSWSLITC